MKIDNLISQNKTGTKLEMCTKLIAIQNKWLNTVEKEEEGEKAISGKASVTCNISVKTNQCDILERGNNEAITEVRKNVTPEVMLPKGKVWGRETKINLERPGEPDDEEPGVHAKGVRSQQMISAEEWHDRFQCKKNLNAMKKIDWRRAWLKAERSDRRLLQQFVKKWWGSELFICRRILFKRRYGSN